MNYPVSTVNLLEVGLENYFSSVVTDPSTRQPLGLQQDPTSSSLGYNNSSRRFSNRICSSLKTNRRKGTYLGKGVPVQAMKAYGEVEV